MNEDQLREYLDELVRCHDLVSEGDFADFLKLNPDAARKITCASNDVFWLHFESHTFDGWYCIKDPRSPKYHVYFKEHGRTYGSGFEFGVQDYEKAVVKALTCHGILKL